MNADFPEWLELLATAKKGPLQMPVAVRGQEYSHHIRVEGDFTGDTLTGQVRASPDADSPLVSFSIGTPDFDAGFTTWTVSLAQGSGANSTGVLPVDGTGTGVQYFPYDFLLQISGSNPERLIGGLLPVSGHITEPV